MPPMTNREVQERVAQLLSETTEEKSVFEAPKVKMSDWFDTKIYGFLRYEDARLVVLGKIDQICTYSYPGAERPRQMNAIALRMYLPKTEEALREAVGYKPGVGINGINQLRASSAPFRFEKRQ